MKKNTPANKKKKEYAPFSSMAEFKEYIDTNALIPIGQVYWPRIIHGQKICYELNNPEDPNKRNPKYMRKGGYVTYNSESNIEGNRKGEMVFGLEPYLGAGKEDKKKITYVYHNDIKHIWELLPPTTVQYLKLINMRLDKIEKILKDSGKQT